MNHEAFKAKVELLQSEAEANPEAYKFKVLLVALLGYAYPAMVIVILLALVGLLVYILLFSGVSGGAGTILFKLMLPLLAVIFMILRSLWIKIPHPTGIEIDREQAGPLFQSVSQFREKLHGPRVHTILLTDDFNAGVVQVPLLGLFGWPKNYLIVGLPLLQALSPQEFYGVLAHEFGHLAGAHSRFSGWIYRVKETWNRLRWSLEQSQHWSNFIFKRFMRWYVPYFNAYAFVHARSQEYDADRSAAQLIGSRTMADALIRVSIGDQFLESRHWPSVYKKANTESEPPAAPFTQSQEAFTAWVGAEEARRFLARSLKEKTGYQDTHPSLSDRIAALGEEARLPDPPAKTAADHFLGEHLAGLTSRLNQSWRANILEAWRERYRQAQEAERRLNLMATKSEALTFEEKWERAYLTEEFRDAAAALPLYQEVLSADANHAGANFSVGRLTLEKKDETGVGLIERAMEIDQQYIIPACELLHGFFREKGEEQLAQKYFDVAMLQSQAYESAQIERAGVNLHDRFIPHNLSAESLDSIKSQLAKYDEIDRAYLVGKALKLMPEVPFYILGFTVDAAWYKYRSHRSNSELCSRIANEIAFQGDLFILYVGGENKPFRKKMEKINGALIYKKLG